MSKDTEVRPNAHDGPMQPGNDARRAARRRLLTTLGAGAAATAALPATWKKPIAESVLLPAHAQTSVEPSCPGFRIELVWDTCARNGASVTCDEAGAVNGALVVVEPGGQVVGPGSPAGEALKHTGDTGTATRGRETVTLRDNALLKQGEYRIGVGYGDAMLRVAVIRCDGSYALATSFISDYSEDLVEAARMYVEADGTITAAASPDYALF